MTGEQPYFLKTVEYLNLVFGESPASLDYWNTDLKFLLKKRFPDALAHFPDNVNLKAEVMNFKPPAPGLNDESPTGLCMLFIKFSSLSAIRFTGTASSWVSLDCIYAFLTTCYRKRV